MSENGCGHFPIDHHTMSTIPVTGMVICMQVCEIFTLVKDVDGSYVGGSPCRHLVYPESITETLQDRKRTNAMALLNKFFKRIFGKKIPTEYLITIIHRSDLMIMV